MTAPRPASRSTSLGVAAPAPAPKLPPEKPTDPSFLGLAPVPPAPLAGPDDAPEPVFPLNRPSERPAPPKSGKFITPTRWDAPPEGAVPKDVAPVHSSVAVTAESMGARPEPKAAAVPAIPRLIAGRYRLGDRLAAGGAGEVYRARQVDLDRDVALRVLVDPTDSDELARFAREAKVTADIRHSGVVQVFDAGVTDEGMPYVATELLEGQTLANRVGREGALSARESVRIAIDTCRALEAVHERGVVHRNLQPSSIFLARKGDGGYEVKLIDFGVAKRVAVPEDVRHTARIKLGMIGPATPDKLVGTPAYQSPEQVLGHPVDPRADVYALAVTLYQIVAGAPPFEGKDDEALFNAILTQEPTPLRKRALRRDVSAALEAEVARALSKDKADRHTDASDFAAALERVSVSPAARVSSPSRTPGSGATQTSRLRVLLVAGASLALVAALVAGYLLHRGAPAAAPGGRPATMPAP